MGEVRIWCEIMLSKLRGVSTTDVSVKVAATIAGEVAVRAGVGPHASVGQHVALLISLSDESTATNTAQEPHLQEKTLPQCPSWLIGKVVSSACYICSMLFR